MSSNSEHRSRHSSRKNESRDKKEISIDNLFPSDNKSGTKGVKLDVESLFSGTPLNHEPEITFSSNILVERTKKRRLERLSCYTNMLKYCHNRILAADEDQGTDIIFSVVESMAECKDYNPYECLEYISIKLREDDFDTTILTNTTMFITWKYLELKKQDRIRNEETKNNSDPDTSNNDQHKSNNEHHKTINSSKNVREITLNKSIF